MLEEAVIEFKKYVEEFDKSIVKNNLKSNHSFKVMELMKELAFRLNLDKEKIELAGLIGLLHDTGRFIQVKEINSFKDSKLDHAKLGADYLFNEGHIRDFIKDNKYDNIIEKAIRNHNKFIIDSDLNEEELLFTKMIRDMDKVDIYCQTATHYEEKFNADEVTKEVLEAFKDEKAINITKCKTSSDIVLLTLAFIFDINFNESFDILVETDNFDLFLSTVEVSDTSEKLWKKIREVCFDKINRGV